MYPKSGCIHYLVENLNINRLIPLDLEAIVDPQNHAHTRLRS